MIPLLLQKRKKAQSVPLVLACPHAYFGCSPVGRYILPPPEVYVEQEYHGKLGHCCITHRFPWHQTKEQKRADDERVLLLLLDDIADLEIEGQVWFES